MPTPAEPLYGLTKRELVAKVKTADIMLRRRAAEIARLMDLTVDAAGDIEETMRERLYAAHYPDGPAWGSDDVGVETERYYYGIAEIALACFYEAMRSTHATTPQGGTDVGR